jgi:hypothetical protein
MRASRSSRTFHGIPRTGPETGFARRYAAAWPVTGDRLGFRAPPAHKIDDKANQQNQADPSSADGGPAKVKTAAAEQEKKNKDKEYKTHTRKIALYCDRVYGVFPHQRLFPYDHQEGHSKQVKPWQSG